MRFLLVLIETVLKYEFVSQGMQVIMKKKNFFHVI